MIDCGKQAIDKSPTRTWTTDIKALHLRRIGEADKCIYELATAPAQVVLRNILGLSFRTLIDDLALSNTAKYGTWQEVRLLDTPQDTSSSPRGVVTHVSGQRQNLALSTNLRPRWQRKTLPLAQRHAAVQAVELWSLRRVMEELAVWHTFSSNSNALRPSLHPHGTTDSMLMRRDSPLHRFDHQFVQLLSRTQSANLSNTLTTVPWSAAGVYRPGNISISTTMTDCPSLDDFLRLLFSKLHLSRTTRAKIAILLPLRDLQDLGVSIEIHATKEGRPVSVQSANAQKRMYNFQMADAGAIVDFFEIGNATASRCENRAFEFAWKTLLQVRPIVPYLLERNS